MMPKSPVATSSCSATPPPSAPPSAHLLPTPSASSNKPATKLQPMDLDHMKSRNPPGSVTTVTSQGTSSVQCRYTISRSHPGNHRSCEDCCWRNTMQGEEDVNKIKPMSDESKELQDF